MPHIICTINTSILRLPGYTVNNIGRPEIEIDIEKVRELRVLGFSWTTIAERLHISRQTLYRRLEGCGMMGYTDISDHELDSLIQCYKETHPNDGEAMTIGHLRSCGVHVPRARIRGSIHRVDPSGVEERRQYTIRRRKYHVEAPNFVWHLDGNHKLIRWKFVIHGAIDGYSRVITFLTCSSNNRADTVLHSFVNAVSTFGLPHKVRTDGGGENVHVWEYMIEQRGDSTCVVVGSSVHNVRIERLWKDVRRGVLDTFREIFAKLEDDGKLDVENDVDLFCLHQVFTGRIQKTLSEFVHSWNNHPLSSEGSRTPLQLFDIGLEETEDSSVTGGEEGTALPTVADHVEVPTLRFMPCSDITSQIGQLVNGNQQCDGYSLYHQVTTLIGQHLGAACNDCNYA